MDNKEKTQAPEVKQPTAQEQMQMIQSLHQENQQLRQQNKQLFQEYQKITSVYARLDYLYGVLRSDMRDQFSADFIVECSEEVEKLIRAFKVEEVKDGKAEDSELEAEEEKEQSNE